MDNTKKRKIVRNFVIGYLIIQVLTIVVYLGFWSLHPEGITNVTNECTRSAGCGWTRGNGSYRSWTMTWRSGA